MIERVYKTANSRKNLKTVHAKRKELVVDTKSSADVLLEDIFVINPKTGYPMSDISQFMSPDTSPEVKQFIQEQLHRPLPVLESPKVSDDDMSKYSRQGNESKSEYLARIASDFPQLLGLEESKSE